jgi:preprotein translocase subunit SecY
MSPEQAQLLKETYELSKENNKMLHSARRSAFIGGLLKMAMYAAFIILPSYFFYTNIVPMLTETANKVNTVQEKVQGAAGQAQTISNTINQYKDLINGGGQ